MDLKETIIKQLAAPVKRKGRERLRNEAVKRKLQFRG